MNNSHLSRLKNNYSQQLNHCHHRHQQQGAVLIVAIVFLLIITILGLGAIRMSGIDTQIAGNSMVSMLTYQGAESTLAKSGQEKYILRAAKGDIGDVINVPATDLPAENVGVGVINSKATIQPESMHQKCPDHIAISTKFKCSIYRIDANSQMKGSGSKSQHVMGWAETEASVNQHN